MKAQHILGVDYLLLLSSIALTVFGVLFIYSSGINSAGVQSSTEYSRQIIWGVSGFILAIALLVIDYHKLHNISFYVYLGTLGLLIYTCIFGKLVSGARAWLGIGDYGVQPSEFAKITTIIFLARYLDNTKRKVVAFTRFLVSCIIVFVPMLLILLQPDLGTALVFIPILLIMTFVAGVSVRYVVFLGAVIGLTSILMVLPLWQSYIMENALPSLAILINGQFIGIAILALSVVGALGFLGLFLYKKSYFFWIVYGTAILILSLGLSYLSHKVLRDYQIMRLIVFLDPSVDAQGAGWNINQSIIAIGSGGMQGKGYLQGTQSHYSFVPQQSTDFIFSIFAEEWGFRGGVVVFGLFLLICFRFLRIIKLASDTFGAYISAGLSAMYIFHFLINVGMTMGIMPITGIPLLFMSYGGSSIISAMSGIGLALSIHLRRFEVVSERYVRDT
ncbi:MAG: rod shape-determining protein RodA [Treponema sp.]|jgi:rod shape determining protein RodA|nr:rod shape-determining protein RodA [Treponema sp.]